MIEQQPETPDKQANGKTRTDFFTLNLVPWTAQVTFRAVLITLIPWIGFNLLLAAMGGNSGPAKPLSPGEDLGGALVSLVFSLVVEGAFLIAPYYYANKALVSEMILTGAARTRAVFRSLGLRKFRFWRTLPWIIGLMLLIIGIDNLYSFAITALGLNIQTNDQVVLQYSTLEPMTTYALLAAAVFISPFCEELFFRGFVLPGLLRDLSPVWAIAISATLFAIAHADLGSFIPLLAIGLCLGFLRWRTGSPWASMSLHILNNLLSSISIVLYMHHINVPF